MVMLCPAGILTVQVYGEDWTVPKLTSAFAWVWPPGMIDLAEEEGGGGRQQCGATQSFGRCDRPR